MPTSQTRSQAVRQHLHLRIQPSPYTSPKVLITPHTPAFSQNNPPQDTDENDLQSSYDVMLSVLCLYDYEGGEPTLLSFKKSEILDIVKCDESGWWAAMRRDGPVVGWIPQGYVAPLSEEMADRLRGLREDYRIPEYDAELLYVSAPVVPVVPLDDEPNTPSSEAKENAQPTPPTRSTPLLHRSRSVIQANGGSPRPQPPPSPTSPMPQPPVLGLKRATSHARLHEIERTNTPPLSSRSLRRREPIPESDPLRTQTFNSMRRADKSTTPESPSIFDALKRKQADAMTRRKDTHDKSSGRPSTAVATDRWYLQPRYAGQIDEDGKGHIRSGTLQALVERLTTDITTNNQTRLAEQKSFTNAFLMTYWTFTTAQRLLEMLVDRFHMSPPEGLTDAEHKDWKANLQIPVQRRILDVISSWIEEYHLLEEPGISHQLTDFLARIIFPPHATRAFQLVKTIDQLSAPNATRLNTAASPKKARKAKPPKNDLAKLDPVDVAEQLTLVEFALYAKVTPQECLRYARHSGDKSAAPNLVEFCATHDKLGRWIKLAILNIEVLGKRAGMVDFWIRVAEKCRSLNNFFSMSAIINALSSTDITRLHLTWAHVDRKAQLDALLRHNEPTGGFAGYRSLLQHTSGPCVPFIAMYLVDNHHIHDQFRDSDGQICFYQKARWYEIISNMTRFQSKPYTMSANESIMAFIENQFRDGALPDDSWYYNKSQEVQHSELAHADIRRGLEAAGF
ncbi:hypothetical protein CVT24_008641 [Panaeolus cyanescens]|uniref:Ras GEF n=1 Tax=Panaeolus cyanescens TaxID=181874 RepID=A0A409VBB4_9AGAR|nr:hypothetical protein CVT24_008641 [Panaeolus cyanescens]